MPTPSFAFALLIATLIGSAFHFLVNGSGKRLAYFILFAWGGFALGQVFGDLISARVLSAGSLHLLHGSIGALLADASYLFALFRRS